VWHAILCVLALATNDTTFAVALPVLVRKRSRRRVADYDVGFRRFSLYPSPLACRRRASQVAVTPRGQNFPAWAPLLGASLLSLSEAIPDI
jgi:hypothetical protein